MSKKSATLNQKDKANGDVTTSEIAARLVPSRKYAQLTTKTKFINKFVQTKRKVTKIGNSKYLLATRRELRKTIKQITCSPVTIKFVCIYKGLTKTVIYRTDFITKPIKKKLQPPISLFIRRFNKVVDRLGRKRVKWVSYGLFSTLVVVAIAVGSIAYIHNLINSSYNLPVNEQALIGSPDTALMKSQLTYNSKTKTYYLDKSGIDKSSSSTPGVPSGDNSISIGSKSNSAFSLVIPTNIHQGFTAYDNTYGLSFTLTPEFDAMNAKMVDGHLVYPMGLNSTKDVYTIKANGLQENIVYNSAPAGTVKLAYKLTLPNTLQAKMMPDGNVGIYSANSYLFGNISYGSAKDQALVAKARLNAAKTNLVFVLPAPEITDNDGMAPTNVQQQTKFSLKGDILTLTASDLGGIHGPISIDPSVIDASASSFGQGNNESDISFANSSISEAGLSGGGLAGNTNSCGASWCASNGTAGTGANLPAATYQATAVAYNGYVYQIGGYTTAATAVVDYAAITSSGALAAPASAACTAGGGSITGDWCASNGTAGTGANLPAATYYATAVAYNGYVYQIGGHTTAATAVVDYAAITSSGALAAPASAACTAGGGTIAGDWCASNGTAGTGANLPAATYVATAVAYNGYVYQIGGCSTACPTAVVDYAAITSSGALAAPASAACTAGGGTIAGDWCASNGTAGTGANLPAATYQATAVAYNGYVYQIGGVAGSVTAVVDYAAITSTGALAAPGSCAGTITGYWCASTSTANGSLPAATYVATAVAYNGYVYQIGGVAGAVVDYAPIYNGGNIGPWSSTTSLPAATQNATAVAYNGYVYQIGGYTTAATAVVDYAAISSPGDVAPWTASTSTANGSLPAATYYATAVAYNGYVYQIGGEYAGGVTAVVDYAAITSTGALAAPGSCAGTITGYWCASTSTANGSLPAATYGAAAVAYNGYVYQIGGGIAGSVTAVVDYAAITSTGALAAPGSCAGTITGYWCASTSTSNGSLPAATYYATAVAYNGYVYQIGGCSTACPTAVVDYAAITSSGALAAPGSCAGTITGYWCASTSTANGSLPAVTYGAAAVAYNGYVYQIGGYAGSPTAVVDYAAITSTGALAAPASAACTAGGGSIAGDWCASNGTAGTGANLPAVTYGATAVAYNGYVYQIGGCPTACPTAVVDYAAITSSGALAAPGSCAGTITGYWCASTSTSNGSLPAATYGAAAVAYNGYVYQIGGYAGSPTAVVDYAAINNGGPATLSAWAATGSLPAATYYATAVAYNGYVYQIGGEYAGGVTAVVDYAAITSTGALAAPGSCAGTITGYWCASTSTSNGSLPAATYYATAVAYNGYVYQIGGCSTACPTAVVDYAAITSSGALAAPASAACTAGGGSIAGDWCASNGTAGTGANLPAVTYGATAVAYNGYVYQIGGYAGIVTAVVDYAAITSSGALAAPGSCAGTITGYWCASTSTSNGSLPAATYLATAVAYNGYVYQIGGCSTACPTAVVDYAAINSSTGAVGTWTATGSLPAATYVATAVTYNGYVYQIGGEGYAGSVTAVVDYAPIYNGGNIGPWSSTTSLPAATYHATAVAYNGYVYQIGGYTTAATAVVDYAGLQSMPRIGFYSQLIDMSGSSTEDPAADYILANGSQTGDPGIGGLSGPGTGGISINYQFASNACPTFNSSTALTTSALVLGTPYPMTSSSNGCSSSSDTNFGRWVWVTVKLDDSQTATFPDSSGNHATITGFTLYYHPATNGRLRGGATFSNNSLQSLDAPP